jgi:2-polyprenyl-3-methyl-5-hydroxy-6-metoxy-1,4-benzoquinol methylase
MEYMQNIIEYYDELFPVSNDQKLFYEQMLSGYEMPAKILNVGCATGSFDNALARAGHDVTGIDSSKELLETANRRRRLPNTAIRFFQMTTLEMARFLGKSFYDIISCFNNNIIKINDEILLRKFFYDCFTLLAPNGTFLIQVDNFQSLLNQSKIFLPTKESIRSKLLTELTQKDTGEWILNQEVERSDGKVVPVILHKPVFLLTKSNIETYAKEAGFSKIDFYGSYKKEAFTDESPLLVAVLRK